MKLGFRVSLVRKGRQRAKILRLDFVVPFDVFGSHWREAGVDPISTESSMIWILLDKNVFDLRAARG